MERIRNDNKNYTKYTKRVQKLENRVNEPEMMIKRLQLEFSWYESKNDYAHCAMNDGINRLNEGVQPF